MCETLPTASLNNPMKNIIDNKNYARTYDPTPKYSEAKSITEPDNGHKTESVTKPDLRLESERLRTFTNWKSDAVTAEDLAKSGFYFLNNPTTPDLVKCAFCNAEICRWEAGDDALEEHTKWSPSCPFLKQNAHVQRLRTALPQGQDVCGGIEHFPNSVPESEAFRLLRLKSFMFDDLNTRLKSFAEWPQDCKQRPEALAAAGFYYRGVEDHTICFDCNGALRDWKDDDDPWEQHAMWFPGCKFLLGQKGQGFVDEVQRKLKSGIPSVTKEKEEKLSVSEQGASASRDDGVLLCKICDAHERNMIFMPCKHILACEQCAALMEKCPVCRKRIDQTLKVFLS